MSCAAVILIGLYLVLVPLFVVHWCNVAIYVRSAVKFVRQDLLG